MRIKNTCKCHLNKIHNKNVVYCLKLFLFVSNLFMIPDLDENGWLPPGIHTCQLHEVEKQFTYNQSRKTIFEGLKKLIKVLQTVYCGIIYLDGSFVTSKSRPGDVDVCWQETTGTDYDYEFKNAPILNPTAANKKYHKEVFKADIFPADIV
jgi:hypothetical protein